jgi:hypothetical protein
VDPAHPGAGGQLYFFKEQPASIAWGTGQSVPVRDIAQLKRTTNWFVVGHWQAPGES